MGGKGKRYSPRFQVVLEVLKGDRDAVEIARAYELHPSTVSRWKREFLEHGLSLEAGVPGERSEREHDDGIVQRPI